MQLNKQCMANDYDPESRFDVSRTLPLFTFQEGSNNNNGQGLTYSTLSSGGSTTMIDDLPNQPTTEFHTVYIIENTSHSFIALLSAFAAASWWRSTTMIMNAENSAVP